MIEILQKFGSTFDAQLSGNNCSFEELGANQKRAWWGPNLGR